MGIWCVGAFSPGVHGRTAHVCVGTPVRPAGPRRLRLRGGLTSPLSPRGGGTDTSTPTLSSPAWPPSWLTTPGHRGAASAAWPPAAATPATKSETPAAGPAPAGRPPGPQPPPLGCSMSGDRPGRPPLAPGNPQNPYLALNCCRLPYLSPSPRAARARRAINVCRVPRRGLLVALRSHRPAPAPPASVHPRVCAPARSQARALVPSDSTRGTRAAVRSPPQALAPSRAATLARFCGCTPGCSPSLARSAVTRAPPRPPSCKPRPPSPPGLHTRAGATHAHPCTHTRARAPGPPTVTWREGRGLTPRCPVAMATAWGRWAHARWVARRFPPPLSRRAGLLSAPPAPAARPGSPRVSLRSLRPARQLHLCPRFSLARVPLGLSRLPKVTSGFPAHSLPSAFLPPASPSSPSDLFQVSPFPSSFSSFSPPYSPLLPQPFCSRPASPSCQIAGGSFPSVPPAGSECSTPPRGAGPGVRLTPAIPQAYPGPDAPPAPPSGYVWG